MIQIETKADIEKIQCGDQYIIVGPDDPEEFFQLHTELTELINAHIEKVCNKQEKPDQFVEELLLQLSAEELAECYRKVDALGVARKYNMKGYSKYNELDLWKFVKENYAAIK